MSKEDKIKFDLEENNNFIPSGLGGMEDDFLTEKEKHMKLIEYDLDDDIMFRLSMSLHFQNILFNPSFSSNDQNYRECSICLRPIENYGLLCIFY